MEEKIILEIKVPRENEYTTEVAAGFFSSLSRSLKTPGFFGKLKKEKPQTLVLEIACFNQQIRFYAIFEPEFLPFFESQILAAWPLAVLDKTLDYLSHWQNQVIFSGQLIQTNSFYYPIKTYQDFKDVDPLSSVLAVMSKAGADDFLLVQIVLQAAPKNWQKRALSAVEQGIKISQTERQPLPAENLIKQKANEVGLRTGIRLLASSSSGLNSLIGAFAVFSRGDGNSLGFKAPNLLIKNKFRQAIFERTTNFVPPWQIFSSSELATLWHLPNQNIKIPNIAWGRVVLSEARKYRLNLCLANQYMAQITKPVQKAILGNAGTLISFLVGAEDAKILEKEFGRVFSEKDLVRLSNLQIIIKLAIDNLTSRLFFAYTLPLPVSRNQNREKVLRVSRQRYSYRK